MWFEWLKGLGFSFANEKLVQLAIFFWKCKICRITRFYDKTKPKGQTDVLKKIKWRWSEVFFIAMVVHCIPNYFHPFTILYNEHFEFLEIKVPHQFQLYAENISTTNDSTFYFVPIYIEFLLHQAYQMYSFKHLYCISSVIWWYKFAADLTQGCHRIRLIKKGGREATIN